MRLSGHNGDFDGTQKWKALVYSGAFHSRNPQPLSVPLRKRYTKYHFSWFLLFLTWLHVQGKCSPSFPEDPLHLFPWHTAPWISLLLTKCYSRPPQIQLFAKQHINLPNNIFFPLTTIFLHLNYLIQNTFQ